MKRHAKLGLSVVFVALGTHAAFAQAPSICAKPTEVAGFTTCADIAKAEAEGEITVVSTDIEQGTAKMLAAFNQAFPKIKTSYVRGLAATIYAKVNQELQAGVFHTDVINLDAVLSADFLKKGGYAQYVSPESKHYKASYKSNPEGYWIWGQIALAGLAYNPKTVNPEDAPKSWKDMVDPKWTGGVNAKSAASGVQHFVWYTVKEKMGPDFWPKFGELKPRAFDSQVQQYDRLVNGEDKLAEGGQYAGFLEYKSRGAPVEFIFPEEGTPASPQIWGVLAKAPHPEAARLFLDWFLSSAGQKVMQEVLFLHSPRDDAAPPPGGVSVADKTLLVPANWDDYAASRRTFSQEWSKYVGSK